MAVGNSDHLTLLNSYKVQIRRDGQETGLYSRASGCVILLESVCCGGKILRESAPRVAGYTRSPIRHFHTTHRLIHLFYPPKFCIRIFFQFLLGITVLQFMHFFCGGGGGVGANEVSWVMRKLANYPLSSSLSFACQTNKPHPHALPRSRETRRMTGKTQV